MAIDKPSYNWLLVLELDFDPPTDDESFILSTLAEKQRFWGEQSLKNQTEKEYFTKLKDSVDEIKSTLLDGQTRKALARQACEKVYGYLDKYLETAAKAAGAGDDIEASRLAAVQKKLEKKISKDEGIKHWSYPIDFVQVRAEKLGYRILEDEGSHSDDEAKSAYEPYSKKSKWSKFSPLKKALDNFGQTDLYAFAFPDSPKAARTETADRLLERLKRIKDEKAIHHNQEKTDSETIYSKAKEIFDSKAHRSEYDVYLEFLEVNKVLGDFKDEVELSDNAISEEIVGRFEGRLIQVLSDKSKASLIIRGFCIKEKYRFNRTSNTIVCRCGFVNASTSPRCAGCGLPLRLTCLKCGKSAPNTFDYCECGAVLGKAIGDAEELCDRAEVFLGSLDVDSARRCLDDARKSCPELGRVDEIGRRLSDVERGVGAAITKLKACLAASRFFEAREILGQIKGKHPSYSLSSADESRIEAACNQADAMVARAKAAPDAEKFDLFSKALFASSDCSEALAYMTSNKPKPPTRIEVRADGLSGVVSVSWSASPSPGIIEYVVRRKQEQAPSFLSDGELVAKTGALQVQDSDAAPGSPCWYAVFAQRFGVTSAMAVSSSPALLLKEVEGLSVIPADSSVEFSWKPLSGGSKVEIIDETNGSKTIALVVQSRYVHSGLQNGRTCRYRVRVVYFVMGQEQKSEGILVEATPIDAGEAICDLRVARDRDSKGFFNLSWTQKPGQEIVIFSTKDRSCVPKTGSLTALASVERACQHADICSQMDGKARLRYTEDTALYVFLATVCGKTAIISNSCRALGKEEIHIRDVYIANDEIAIRIEPPEQAVGFVVLTRSDRFACDIGETGRDGDLTRKMTTKKNFEKNGMLSIKNVGQRDYFISVFAMYGTPSEPTYSEPTEYLFSTKPKDEVSYSIQPIKVPFRPPKVIVTFRSSNRDFLLPATSIVCGVGKLPVFEGEGMQVMSIPERLVSGEFSCEVTGLPKGKNLYLKAMPANSKENPYSLDPHSNAKIC